jgi:hypothetical protein
MNESKLHSVTFRWNPPTDHPVAVLSAHERPRPRGHLRIPQRHTLRGGGSLARFTVDNQCLSLSFI